MDVDTTELSGMSVKEYEQSCRKKLEERTETYENMIVYLRTGKHKKAPTAKDRKQVLRMVSSYHWDDTEEILYYNDGDTKKQVVRNMEEIATIVRLYHPEPTAGALHIFHK